MSGRGDKPRREKKPPRAARGSAVHTKRSTHERCPLCKHIRARWLRANAWDDNHVGWARLTFFGPKVCHICQKRSKAAEEAP